MEKFTTADLAIHQAQVCRDSAEPVKTLLSCAWIPLALLYDELVKAGEIKPIAELSPEQKKIYWRQTEGAKWKRVWQVQAMYLFDLLNQTTAIPDGLESPGIVGEG